MWQADQRQDRGQSLCTFCTTWAVRCSPRPPAPAYHQVHLARRHPAGDGRRRRRRQPASLLVPRRPARHAVEADRPGRQPRLGRRPGAVRRAGQPDRQPGRPAAAPARPVRRRRDGPAPELAPRLRPSPRPLPPARPARRCGRQQPLSVRRRKPGEPRRPGRAKHGSSRPRRWGNRRRNRCRVATGAEWWKARLRRLGPNGRGSNARGDVCFGWLGPAHKRGQAIASRVCAR